MAWPGTSGAGSVQDHFVTVTGLTPGEKYCYRVGTTSLSGIVAGGTADHYSSLVGDTLMDEVCLGGF
jgi:hypothetical protein